MSPLRSAPDRASNFAARLSARLKEAPAAGGRHATALTPGVVDVMGGIGEYSGCLVVTATASPAYMTAAWRTSEGTLRLHYFDDGRGDSRTLSLNLSFIESAGPGDVMARLGGDAGWAAPTVLAVQKYLAGAGASGGGLALLVQTDFPPEADLGRRHAQAAGAVEALCRLDGINRPPFERAAMAAEAVSQITRLPALRKAMTAIVAPPDGVLLQLRFVPQISCERLEMPDRIVVRAMTTRLSRPTTRERLFETRICTEMGHRIIQDLQRADGLKVDPATSRLSAVNPTEYVDRYRDRMPSKISYEQFVARFGPVRGLDGDAGAPGQSKCIYKVRSRAEHHIYENRRVHDFATALTRGRRTQTEESLKAAGDLMYASHWSHSQRCGIGGLETDRLVNHVRTHGSEAGLYGAKVTAGGEGGEMVVLMRDDTRAHAALADAVAKAEAESARPVLVFGAAEAGAEPARQAEAPRPAMAATAGLA